MSAEIDDVNYPQQWQALPLRRLLELSQTDVTPDPEKGYRYAAAAFDRAQGQTEDVTAAGEAAAKASFRAVQLGLSEGVSDGWIWTSLANLTSSSATDSVEVQQAKRRERIATLLLSGRGRALRLLSGQSVEHPDELEQRAKHSFQLAATELREQRVAQGRGRWDPYAPMLSWQHAAFEAARPGGNAKMAAQIAIGGMRQALHVRHEEANSARGFIKHQLFKAKQFTLNAAAFGLALKRRTSGDSTPSLRERAVSMLG